ncbi:MAG: GTP pyrophosphokinase [Lachnospiraceae bacterium]|nr:GTP pyrophosphokinase [Lachnospiraceae bacterium]
MNITKEQFFAKYGISENQLSNAQLSWDALCEIAEDYEFKIKEFYDPLRQDFIKNYFLNKENEIGLQSYRSRCKAPEHVIEKIIRKRNDNYLKYKGINKDNYSHYLTDLIGVRGLLLYREDWIKFHEYIMREIKPRETGYIKDSAQDYVNDGSIFMAEEPKVHIRTGDYYEIYVNRIPLDNILDHKHYRSIHYIVNYKGAYVEIQIRTLLEEGWGEIDHDILYPHKLDNQMLKEFSELLNRLVGMGDEMSSYYKRLEKVPENEFLSKKQSIKKPSIDSLHYIQGHKKKGQENCKTFHDVINYIIKE